MTYDHHPTTTSILASFVMFAFLLPTSHAYYNMDFGYGLGGIQQRQPMCERPSSPCRLRVTVGSLNGGSEVESNGVQTCTCSPPNNCSHEWSSLRHVVSRKVVATTFNITLQMMFCRPVVPIRRCRRGDISLVVKGSMHMPQDISSYNCRCRRRQPLLLHERRIGDDHMTYHTYVCANQKRVCRDSTTHCMAMGEDSTEYPCKCQEGYQCRADFAASRGQDVTYGFCAR